MDLGVELEAAVAAEFSEALGHAVAVVLHHGHVLLVELGDHGGSPGPALELAQRLADGPADVV